jgi:hypothetical protein
MPAIASAIPRRSSTDPMAVNAAAATSNSACAKPSGWDHCRPVELVYAAASSAALCPVSERVARRPPDLRGQVRAQRAELLDGRREQQRLADRRDPRVVALLRGLPPERGEVRRVQHPEQDLGVGVPERGDVPGEVLAAGQVGAGVDEPVAAAGEARREPGGGVPPGQAVGVDGPERPGDAVGRDLVPHVRVDRLHVLQSPGEQVRPLERGARLRAAPEEPRLPGRDRGDAGHPARLALVADRVGGVRRRRDEHQVDAVVQDEVGGDVGGPAGIGLAVALEDLDLARAARDPDRVLGEELAERGDDVLVGLAERCQRPALRAHVPDPDHVPAGGAGRATPRRRGRARESGPTGDRGGSGRAEEAAAVQPHRPARSVTHGILALTRW